jgi:hypothetical protein
MVEAARLYRLIWAGLQFHAERRLVERTQGPFSPNNSTLGEYYFGWFGTPGNNSPVGPAVTQPPSFVARWGAKTAP